MESTTLTFVSDGAQNSLSLDRRIVEMLKSAPRLGLRVVELDDLAREVRLQTIEECCALLCADCKEGLPVERSHTWQCHHPDTGHLCGARGLRDLLLATEEREHERMLAAKPVSGLLSEDRRRASA